MDVLSEVQAMEKKKGISGSTLKIIAMTAMLIDHIAAIIFDNFLISKGLLNLDATNIAAATEFMEKYGTIYYLDFFMRCVGRIGFPIFAFLLIEGFLHTKNVKKYAMNLGIFALLSEIPFNLAFKNNPWDLSYQNVFFTLFIGLIVLIGFKIVEEKMAGKRVPSIILKFVILAVGMSAGFLWKTDYAGIGVLTIAAMYFFKKRKMVQAASGCAVLSIMQLTELPAFFSLIPIGLYNGERGLKLKYLFYIFYPAHILILYVIAAALNVM